MTTVTKVPEQEALNPRNRRRTLSPQDYPAEKARQADIVLDTMQKRVVYAVAVGGAVLAGILIVVIALLYA